MLAAAVLLAATLVAGGAASASGPPSNTPGFEIPAALTDGGHAWIETGDLNADDLPDIVAFKPGVPNSLTILTNDPLAPGTFTSASAPIGDCGRYAFNVGAAGIGVLCDDGDWLLLNAAGGFVASASFPLNAPNQGLAKPVVVPTSVGGVPGFAIGIVNYTMQVATSATVYVYTWDGATPAITQIEIHLPGFMEFPLPEFWGMASLDVGGLPSVAWAASSNQFFNAVRTYVLPTDGSAAPVSYETTGGTEFGETGGMLAVGDLNADELDDVVNGGRSVQGSQLAGYEFLIQQPDGSFEVSVGFIPNDPLVSLVGISTAAPSYTGSCYADVVINEGSIDSTARFMSNSGAQSLAQSQSLSDIFVLDALDLDADSRADILYLNAGGEVVLQLQNELSPVFTSQPADVASVPEGFPASFSVATTPGPTVAPTGVQWQVAAAGGDVWADIPGAQSAEYEFTAAAGDEGNRYRALVTTADGYSALSCWATLVDVTAVGALQVTKTVDGNGEHLVGDAEVFEVGYSYPLPGGGTEAGTLELSKAAPSDSIAGIPADTVVTLSEAVPSVPGVIFGTPAWTGVSLGPPVTVTIVGDTTVDVGVTNTATLGPTGGVGLALTVDGPDGAAVPDDTQFLVDYSYVNLGTAGGGQFDLTKLAPNAVLSGLQPDTVVTFTLTAPAAAGFAFGPPVWAGPVTVTPTGATVTIVENQTLSVGLAYSATAVAPPDPPGPPGPGLPTTGFAAADAWLLAALLLAFGTTGLVLAARRTA